MNSIDSLFQSLRAQGRKAFMPFVTAGDPSLAFIEALLPALAAAGASMMEIGVPFSDPVADGPVIQASYTRALAAGFTLDQLFASVNRVTATGWATPLVAMASYSLIFKRGPTRFISDAQAAGFSGAIVPDLPVEEAAELAAIARERDFKTILLVTPTTSPKRAEAIVKACSGFVYVVSVVGITGAREAVPAELAAMLARLRTMTDLPLCVGFGVSTPQHVQDIGAIADGVIVGSALVKLMDQPDALTAVPAFCNKLAAGLK